MNLYILYFFFFSFHFINGFKISSDASCAFVNSDEKYTYTWVFKEFKDFCNDEYLYALSEKFYSPIINSQGEYYSYRIYLRSQFKSHKEGSDFKILPPEYLEISLKAFKTDSEK